MEKARGHLLINKLPRNMVSIRKIKKKSEERKKGEIYFKMVKSGVKIYLYIYSLAKLGVSGVETYLYP